MYMGIYLGDYTILGRLLWLDDYFFDRLMLYLLLNELF
tara:strand:- start:286 stop:399 length:114 start_codon:yes stop_codon:yes gene_type:complete